MEAKLRTRIIRSLALPVLLSGLILFSPVPTSAQQTPNSRLADWSNLHQISTGSVVKVRTLNLKKHRGRLVEVTEDSLILERKKQQHEIPREEIVRVQVAEPFHRGRRTLKRAGEGAGIAAAVVAKEAFDPDCFCETREAFADVGIAAIVGGVAGTFAGLFAPPKYRLVYETWEANHAWRGPRD